MKEHVLDCYLCTYTYICIYILNIHFIYSIYFLWQWADGDVLKYRNQHSETAVLCQLEDWLNRQWQSVYKIWWYWGGTAVYSNLLAVGTKSAWLVLLNQDFFLLRTEAHFTFICWPFLRIEVRNKQTSNLDSSVSRCPVGFTGSLTQGHLQVPAAICQTMKGPS